MTRIGFIGLGAMGSRMARHLAASHTLSVYNRSAAACEALRAAGASVADSPAAAARDADIVFTMVTDDDAARAVWLDANGVVSGLARDAVAIECSTTTPAWVRELAPHVEARGAALLDCPVAGSTPQADAAQLVVIAGGDEAALDAVRPALAAFSRAVLHTGPLGSGAVVKLVVNALFAGQVALVSELLGAAAAHGVTPGALVDLLAKTPVLSPAAEGAARLMVAEDDAPRFPVDLVAKDLRYAAGLGGAPLVAALSDRYRAASAAGLGELNLTAIRQLSAQLMA